MNKRRFLLTAPLALAGAALAGAARAQQAEPPQVAGTYSVIGRNANGTIYEGSAELRQEGSDVEIFWNVGGQSYSGRGTIEGRVVTIEWGADWPIVYVVMGSQLHGTWDNGAALERLTLRAG
ncbi:MAG: hypothetical protein RIG84_18375 [Roseovarius sp.]